MRAVLSTNPKKLSESIGMRAMQEETFGPTLPIATFVTEADAIRLANDSEFGLTASVWTRDRAKGDRVVSLSPENVYVALPQGINS